MFEFQSLHYDMKQSYLGCLTINVIFSVLFVEYLRDSDDTFRWIRYPPLPGPR